MRIALNNIHLVFTKLLIQHEDFPDKAWVICSLCQKQDERNAKMFINDSQTTTQMLRHLKDTHKEVSSNKKQKGSNLECDKVSVLMRDEHKNYTCFILIHSI